jgi:CheY-like chemotaxis protein
MVAPAKILVVDDEEFVRRNFKRALSEEGYEVETAEDGERALESIEKEPFDLIIADMKMPGMNGIDVLKNAKERHPDIGVIIVTGYSTIETAVEAIKSGASDYIEKPLSTDQLYDATVKALAQRRLEVEHLPAPATVRPEEIFPADYEEEKAEEWQPAIRAFRTAVEEGRVDYSSAERWTYRDMKVELARLLSAEIERKLMEKGMSLEAVTRYRPTLLTICDMIRKGRLLVLLERWTQPFVYPGAGLCVAEKFFEGLYLPAAAKHGSAERKLKAFEREIYRGNLCAARPWDLDDIMKSFNDYDRLFRGGCFGRRKCHMDGIAICQLGFDEVTRRQ